MSVKLGKEVTELLVLDLGYGVKVKARPVNAVIYKKAKIKGLLNAAALMKDQAVIKSVGGQIVKLPDLSIEENQRAVTELLFYMALGKEAIAEWSGVLDQDDNPSAVNEENINTLFLLPNIADNFANQYLSQIIKVISEGEGLGSEPNGAMAPLPNTVKPVEGSI